MRLILIGKREIVGFGINGQPQYFDFEDVPAPSIRWAEETAEIAAIRNKEKGEWKNLTIDEKKACLYHLKRIHSIIKPLKH